jgi:hypothetical protein
MLSSIFESGAPAFDGRGAGNGAKPGGGEAGSSNRQVDFVHFGVLRLPGRELRDTLNVRAFWRVAPSVRLSLRAIWAAGVFCRASDLSSRTSCAVHSRLFDFLTTMSSRGCAIKGVYVRRSL